MHSGISWRWRDNGQLSEHYHRYLLLCTEAFCYVTRSSWSTEPPLIVRHRSSIIPRSRRGPARALLLMYTLGDPGGKCSHTSTLLTRPYRLPMTMNSEYARVVFQNSVLPNLINPIGWTTLADPAEPYAISSSLVECVRSADTDLHFAPCPGSSKSTVTLALVPTHQSASTKLRSRPRSRRPLFLVLAGRAGLTLLTRLQLPHLLSFNVHLLAFNLQLK